MIRTLAAFMAILISCHTAAPQIKTNNFSNVSIDQEANVQAVVAPITQTEAINTSLAAKEPAYSEEDLYILSHVICGEAGSTWISNEEQLLVANVVINRVNSPRFPNTIKDVVFQPGQYACTWDGNYYREPDARTIENAKRILNGERFCPDNVLYQSTSPQGSGIYKQIDNTYFCYG